MSYTIIALLALLVHIIINHDVIRNKHYRHETVSAVSFRLLILSIGAIYVTDALWGVLYDARLITAVFIDTTVYFVAMAFTVSFWSRYVIHYLNEKTFIFFHAFRGGLGFPRRHGDRAGPERLPAGHVLV